ncbi:uncharacterized protein [Ptychodera flava]|uniref:uncharacterized protein n=1 Tax=Ptychodera flava TaxID=63121 RepID=UPI00396A3B93
MTSNPAFSTSDEHVEMTRVDGEHGPSLTVNQGYVIKEEENNTTVTIFTSFVLLEKWIRPLFAEFFGTMTLVFVGSLSGLVGYPDERIDVASGLLASAIAHGLVIFFVIEAFAQVSGGHVNPVVTLAVMCCGKLNLILGCFYMVFQLVGAICGSALVLAVLTSEQFDYINGGTTLPGEGISTGQAIGSELFFTTILITVALQVAIDSKSSQLAALAIGMVVVANILAGGMISGPSMNPARSFGPALVTGIWTDHWIYWVGPPVGSLCSVIFFKFILASADTRWVLKSD